MTSHSSCLCLCDQTHCINDITHTLFMTSRLLYIWHNRHCVRHLTLYPSMYNITPSIFTTSYPICTLSPYCFHDNTTTIPDISPAIFDITANVSVSSHRWHTHLYRCIALLMTSQVCKSSHWHTYDIIPNLQPITFTLYDINDHVL